MSSLPSEYVAEPRYKIKRECGVLLSTNTIQGIMAKISIITPVYKVEDYLEKCIDSILNQTFVDFELFIVDDGSPDKCGQIADKYLERDRRVHVIHKENGGAPSARNAGIMQATGDYFYFPDSDDWLEPSYLAEMYDLAKRTGAQLVISGFTMEYYEKGKSQAYIVSVPEKNFDSKDKLRKNIHNYFDNMMMAVPWNKLYDANYIRKKQILFPNMKWDDLHFNMDVLMEIEKIAISSSSGYHFFRSRPGSETTHVFDQMLYFKRKEQFMHIIDVYNCWEVKDHKYMSVIFGYYAGRLVQCIQEIAISDCTDKRKQILKILDDELSKKALKYGKISSIPLSVAVLPMKCHSVCGCIVMGKTIGFVKKHIVMLYYDLKSKTVNKAKIQ